MNATLLPPAGFAIIHSHRLESLREVLVNWMQRQPVRPLGREEILVQSSGIAQWLKMALAEYKHAGIAAGLQVELPSQFVWQLYRAALGDAVPTSLPYDKDNLTWRLLRLLPELDDEVFLPLSRYRAPDADGRKTWHLAVRLADLLDQYQVYRADWLQAWTHHEDIVIRPSGEKKALDPENLWQPALWRAIREDLAERTSPSPFTSRADIHQLALASINAGEFASPHTLPDRIIVFGISSLPRQTLELLAALGQHRQVMLTIMNPCRHFWGDVTAVQDEVRRYRRHERHKPGIADTLSIEDMHLSAPPLLASWGKQGRDYISLLDSCDNTDAYRDWFNGRIDLFDEALPDNPTLLQQIQQDILDLNPIPAPALKLSADDRSISFHIAHSRQREVEILQDQLINALATDPELRPRDIIIMVPDISQYAPHIHAVFGRLDTTDKRFLPYSLADQALRGHDPLLIALEYLLSLPNARVTLNELLDLMEVPAIQQRFALNADSLPTLRQWLSETGVRWGLNAKHREDLELGAAGDAYTWLQGIQRLLLGYALGDTSRWQNVLAHPDMGGLAAADLGPVIALVRQLIRWYPQLQQTRSVADWESTLLGDKGLLDTFFDFTSDHEVRMQSRLVEGLNQMAQAAQDGQYDGDISLPVLRDAWLAGVDQTGLSQRFMIGSLTFSTLLPMRAIPFQRIYLLGMQDGDYPRSRRPDDFDLMVHDYRPGDRSRRDDDRYLFLEALLSARQALSISWVGRQARDNSETPPSVLVNQLRDMIDQGWLTTEGKAAGTELTRTYPLQPFSAQYFLPETSPDRYQTWAYEWEMQPEPVQLRTGLLPAPDLSEPLTLWHLEDFLKNPVKHYLHRRFKVRQRYHEERFEDDEPFQMNRLEQHILSNELLTRWLNDPDADLLQWAEDMQAANKLPLAVVGSQARNELVRTAESVTERVSRYFDQLTIAPTIDIELTSFKLPLQDRLSQLYIHNEQAIQLMLRPGAIMNKSNPRWHNLISAWVRQLAANAMEQPISTWQFGLDNALYLKPYSPLEARSLLTNLTESYLQGLLQPLPVMPKTAFAWLSAKADKEISDATSVYEQGFQRDGECTPETARYFPDFAALHDAGFATWAETLYAPLYKADWQTLSSNVARG